MKRFIEGEDRTQGTSVLTDLLARVLQKPIRSIAGVALACHARAGHWSVGIAQSKLSAQILFAQLMAYTPSCTFAAVDTPPDPGTISRVFLPAS
jgi:hypothetical protein